MATYPEKGRRRRLTADYRRKHRAAEELGNAIKVSFKNGMETFRRKVDLEDLLRALKTGKMSKVIQTIPFDKLPNDMAELARGLVSVGQVSAGAAYEDLPPTARLSYDLSNPRVAKYIESRTGELITRVKEGTMEAVRAGTARSFANAVPPAVIAEEIKGSIGLNDRQARALSNFRSKLEKDGTSPGKVAKLAEGYEKRLLDQRAIMIARTETRFASNAAQQGVWEEARDDGLLPKNAKRVWVVDGNPCPKICEPMNMVAVGIDEPWTLPDGREVDTPTSSHPNCFCISTLDLGT